MNSRREISLSARPSAGRCRTAAPAAAASAAHHSCPTASGRPAAAAGTPPPARSCPSRTHPRSAPAGRCPAAHPARTRSACPETPCARVAPSLGEPPVPPADSHLAAPGDSNLPAAAGRRGTRKTVSAPLAGCDDSAVGDGPVPPPGTVESLLGTGFQSVAAGDWGSAREAFTAALALAELPEAFFGLSSTLFWLGD